MRISGWSSDVCSSDLADIKLAAEMEVDYLAVSFPRDAADMEYARQLRDEAGGTAWLVAKIERAEAVADDETQIGRASCRERVCQYVSISVVGGSLKKKINKKSHITK